MIPEGAVKEYRHELGPDYGEDLEGARVRVVAYSGVLNRYFVVPANKVMERVDAGWWAYETELYAPTFRQSDD